MANSKIGKNQPDNWLIVLGVLAILALIYKAAVLLLPIVALSLASGYFLYWGWSLNEFEETYKKVVRCFVIMLSGWLGIYILLTLLQASFGSEFVGFANKTLLKKDPSGVRDFFVKYEDWYSFSVILGIPCYFLWSFKFKGGSSVFYKTTREFAYIISAPFRFLVDFAFSRSGSLSGAFTVVCLLSLFMLVIFPRKPSLWHEAVASLVFMSLLWGAYTVYSIKVDQEGELAEPVNHLLSKNKGEQVSGVEIGKLSRGQKLCLEWKDINHHIHILGQPGSGKSVLLRNIYAHHILDGSGLMMIDLKADVDVVGEIITLYSNKREEDKTGLRVLDISRPELSVGYNPLCRGNASELKDKIIGSLEWSEPYYKKISERVLLTLMRAFVYLRDEKNKMPTLGDLVDAISTPDSVRVMSEMIPEEKWELREDLRDLAREMKGKDLLKSLSGIRSDLEAIVKSEFGEIFTSKASVDLLDVIKKKQVFYVLLDGQNYPVQSLRIGRMLLADLRSVSGTIVSKTTKEDRPKFSVIVDEFSDLVSTTESGVLFTGFLNRCRGSGIGVVIAHQSLGDFEDERIAKQVLDSTETLISFVQKDPITCETLASIVGTKDTWEKTEQTETGFLLEGATGMGTRKVVQEFIYHPNVFKNLDIGEAVYMAKKPSRHGVFQVKFLNIDISPIEMLSDFLEEAPGSESLLLLKRKRIEALKGAVTSKKSDVEAPSPEMFT